MISSSFKKCMCVLSINIYISYYNSPLGNSCGVTSSLKNSCATLGCSVSDRVSVNQNWRVLCSCVCFPVCALTRNTLNCRQSWAGHTSPFVTVRWVWYFIVICQTIINNHLKKLNKDIPVTACLLITIPLWSPPAIWTLFSFPFSAGGSRVCLSIISVVEFAVLHFGVITMCSAQRKWENVSTKCLSLSYRKDITISPKLHC